MLNGQCSNFQKNLVSLPKGPSFQCYCMSHGNGSSCPSKGIRAKANGVITNGHHDPEDSENLISNNSPSVGPPDKLSTQDHDDTCCRDRVRNPETDSCISVESGSFTGSLCKGLQGVFHAGGQTWFGSCGRCGSADSGICHSPLNSPSNKCGVNFASLSVDDVLEEDFGPIQMPMPRSVGFSFRIHTCMHACTHARTHTKILDNLLFINGTLIIGTIGKEFHDHHHDHHHVQQATVGSLSKPGRRRQREDPGKDCFRISDAFATLHILILAQISSVSAKVFIASLSLTTEERLW